MLSFVFGKNRLLQYYEYIKGRVDHECGSRSLLSVVGAVRENGCLISNVYRCIYCMFRWIGVVYCVSVGKLKLLVKTKQYKAYKKGLNIIKQ